MRYNSKSVQQDQIKASLIVGLFLILSILILVQGILILKVENTEFNRAIEFEGELAKTVIVDR